MTPVVTFYHYLPSLRNLSEHGNWIIIRGKFLIQFLNLNHRVGFVFLAMRVVGVEFFLAMM